MYLFKVLKKIMVDIYIYICIIFYNLYIFVYWQKEIVTECLSRSGVCRLVLRQAQFYVL